MKKIGFRRKILLFLCVSIFSVVGMKDALSSEASATEKKTRYEYADGYFNITIEKGDKKGKYRVDSHIASLYSGAQEVTYKVTKTSGTDFKASAKHAYMGWDGAPGWANEERLYWFATDLIFKKYKGYQVVVKSEPDSNHANLQETAEANRILLQINTNSLGHTTWCGVEEHSNCHENIKLAYKKNEYTVKYNKNGGTGNIAGTKVTYKDVYEIESKKRFERKGYTLQGYYLKRSSDAKVWGGNKNGWMDEKKENSDKYKIYQPGATVTFGKNLVSDDLLLRTDTYTFVAIWRKNKYAIAYEGNGATSGSIETHTVKYNTKFEIKNSDFLKKGHTFQGYYVIRKSDGKIYCKEGEWKNSSEIAGEDYQILQGKTTHKLTLEWINELVGDDTFTFYAIWEPNTYEVIYQAGNGVIEGSDSSVIKKKIKWGEKIPLDIEVVSKEPSDTFIGWGLSDSQKPLSSLIMEDYNITLHALYSIPVSDVKEVYLVVADKTGKNSSNQKKYEIYPLTRTEVHTEPIRGYSYTLNASDYKEYFKESKTEDMIASVYAVDFAGNQSLLKTYNGTVPPVLYYEQSVVHKFQNLDKDDYEELEIITEQIQEGASYTPRSLSAEMMEKSYPGYSFQAQKSTEIGVEYIVNDHKKTYAYYDAVPYLLTFSANGGKCDKESKVVYTGKSYDYVIGNVHEGFPVPVREGYAFLGWFNAEEGGKQIYPHTIYELSQDSTLYARWQRKGYDVIYDYWTNGGNHAEKELVQVSYGSEIDLQVEAYKEGWEHIGWSLKPNETKGVSGPLFMPGEDVVLYAVYKKEITTDYVDRTEEKVVKRWETHTIYNNETGAIIKLPEINEWNSWIKVGWSLQQEGDASVDVSENETIFLEEDTVFFARYEKEITVEFDANGSPEQIPSVTKTRYYNAAGNYQNPTIQLPEKLEMQGYSFLHWTDPSGKVYEAEEQLEFLEDTVFTAHWDKYPQIEAYDRYFTLKQAQSGEITPKVLLEKVTATDREDGKLKNGTAVTVLHYSEQDFLNFTSDGSVSVTYQATDHVGNRVTKVVTAYIVDTKIAESDRQEYVRFISNEFYKKGEAYVGEKEGGLRQESVWKTKAAYKAALEHALSNRKTDEEVIQNEFAGKRYSLKKAGTGVWGHKKATWNFNSSQIEDIKLFVKENGYGNYKNKNGIKQFYEKFGNLCK